MQDVGTTIELSASSWEQFVGAVLRRAHGQALLATARPRRARRGRTSVPGGRCANLVWMLAISMAGLWLLRG